MADTRMTKAQNILKTVMYSTIATTGSDGMPWAAPQFTVYDASSKAIYWCASRNSQHGQNILHNHKAYVVVYDSMAAPGQGEGVYAQADATEVVDAQGRSYAHDLLLQKHQGVPYWSHEDLQAVNSPIALFKARITQAWINEGREEDGQFVLYREPIEL